MKIICKEILSYKRKQKRTLHMYHYSLFFHVQDREAKGIHKGLGRRKRNTTASDLPDRTFGSIMQWLQVSLLPVVSSLSLSLSF